MTILVTGGTGLIGRAVIQLLIEQGVRPRLVTRRPHRALEYFDHRVTAFEWHPRTEPLPGPALEGVERVVHLMGEPIAGPLSRDKRAAIASSRTGGTRRIAEALRQPIHLIVASSTVVYGYGQGPALTETSTIQPPKSKLALGLLACEEEAERMRDRGCTVTLARLGHIVSRNGFVDRMLSLHERGVSWRDTHAEAALPAIDQADAAALLAWLALSRPMAGPIHAVAPKPLCSAEIKKLLLKQARRRTLVSLPRLALRRRLGPIADGLFNRRQIIPQRALDAGFVFSHPDPLESVRGLLAQTEPARAANRPWRLNSVLQKG